MIREFEALEQILAKVPHHGETLGSSLSSGPAVSLDGLNHREGVSLKVIYTHTNGRVYNINIGVRETEEGFEEKK